MALLRAQRVDEGQILFRPHLPPRRLRQSPLLPGARIPLRFIEHVARPNLKINFDPANVREEPNQQARKADTHKVIKLLKSLTGYA